MPVTCPAEIGGANFVWLKNSYGRGTNEKSVGIVMDARIVFVVVDAELGRVAGLDEILHVKVRDDHLLAALVKRVQPAIRIFFKHIEIGGIVFPAVRVEISKQAHARLFIDEKESAKIT